VTSRATDWINVFFVLPLRQRHWFSSNSCFAKRDFVLMNPTTTENKEVQRDIQVGAIDMSKRQKHFHT
jgi:hypothetical protein